MYSCPRPTHFRCLIGKALHLNLYFATLSWNVDQVFQASILLQRPQSDAILSHSLFQTVKERNSHQHILHPRIKPLRITSKFHIEWSPIGNPMTLQRCLLSAHLHYHYPGGWIAYIFYRSLEVPFLLHPDTEFNCVDASATAAESWLEMPLKADRPLPVRCAVSYMHLFLY